MKLKSTLIAAVSAAAMATSQAFTIDFNAISYESLIGESLNQNDTWEIHVQDYGTVKFTNTSATTTTNNIVEIGDAYSNDESSVNSLQLEIGEEITVIFCGDQVTDFGYIFQGSELNPWDMGMFSIVEEGVEYNAIAIDASYFPNLYGDQGADGVGLQSITWDVVPEPSSAALGAIGMSMILLRRRKA